MIQTNPAWDARNTALGRQPVYAFAIGGEPVVYTTAAVSGVDYRPWLKTPRGAGQSIDVLRGESSIGELECEVVDQAGALRQLVGATTLEGRAATLSVGYPGLSYADFVPLHSYQIYKIQPSRNYTSWIFRSRDRQMAAKRTVYLNPLNGLPIEESNPWILQGTAGEIAQAIYLFALNRPVSEVDVASMKALAVTSRARPFLFVLNQAFEAKQFLETEVYKPAGLYPVIDNLGRVSLKPAHPPAAGASPVSTLDPNNMTVLPEIDRMPVINEIIYRIDAEEDGFANELIFIDASSVSAFGRAGQHVIESRGLRTVLGAHWFCQESAARLFRRFAGGPSGASLRGGAPLARVEAFLMTLAIWAGDYVSVTHPQMPDILTGDLGVSGRLYEVIDREPDFARGRMRYRLLDTGLTGGSGARTFAPSAADFVIQGSGVY